MTVRPDAHTLGIPLWRHDLDAEQLLLPYIAEAELGDDGGRHFALQCSWRALASRWRWWRGIAGNAGVAARGERSLVLIYDARGYQRDGVAVAEGSCPADLWCNKKVRAWFVERIQTTDSSF